MNLPSNPGRVSDDSGEPLWLLAVMVTAIAIFTAVFAALMVAVVVMSGYAWWIAGGFVVFALIVRFVTLPILRRCEP